MRPGRRSLSLQLPQVSPRELDERIVGPPASALEGMTMEDILSQGGDRAPSPWPRRLAVIGALVALVAGGAVYLGVSRHQPATAAAQRLPAAGERPAWFSPASGRSDPIGGLPANQSGYRFSRVGGGWAIQASAAPPAACNGCAWSATPAWFLSDGARSVTRAGPANLVAPAATA